MSDYASRNHHEPVRQYIVVDPLIFFKDRKDEAFTSVYVTILFRKLLSEVKPEVGEHDFVIDSIPRVEFVRGERRDCGDTEVKQPPSTLPAVFAFSSPDPNAAKRVRLATIELIRSRTPVLSIGVDPAIGVSEYSIPVALDGPEFGTLANAHELIGADKLKGILVGGGVNVVVIDTGFDMRIINALSPTAQYGGGWQITGVGPVLPPPALPGMTTGPDGLHGMMVVENILAVAPNARIFDVPLIPPPRIDDIFAFCSVAEAVYDQILQDILYWQGAGIFTGPWIFVNAWAIYDRRSEGPWLGDYTENLGLLGVPPHPFIKRIEDVAKRQFDMVFAAGNCGEICPDDRCGPNDYGPGRGIWGANAHQAVLTTGAVRVDGAWLGYSSEGPGPTPNLYKYKPDLCAPAEFVGTTGLYPPDTGTSCSAAVAAGVVSAVRGRWGQKTVPPAVLKLLLNFTAKQPDGSIGWNRWFGNGILDFGAATQFLAAAYPPPPPGSPPLP
jgi:hypothetical protein